MTKEPNSLNAAGTGISNTKLRDSSSKIIFGDPILCSQFLRGYTGIPLLKDVQPEDIENITERYVHMFVEERNSDTVNRVRLKNIEMPFFLVSLIEHKSKVDYNVVMQILRYMVFIWEDYEKEQERLHPGISKTKDFKYPPILPIVYYDGVDNWTASVQLRERVHLNELLREYIPDFKCILVQLNDYSNEQLLAKQDELSLIMVVNKLHEAADFVQLGQSLNEENINEITAKTPEYLLSVIVCIVEILLAKLNVPSEEVESLTGLIKERNMGELFANFKAYDVQAARAEARTAGREEGLAEGLAEGLEEGRAEGREEGRAEEREESIRKTVCILKDLNITKDIVVEKVMEQYELTEETANKKINLYW